MPEAYRGKEGDGMAVTRPFSGFQREFTIFKLPLVAPKRFRKLDAPEKMPEVFLGATFVDGIGTGYGRSGE